RRPPRALRYDLSLPRYLVARAAGRNLPRVPFHDHLFGLRLVEAAARLRGPDWLRLRPRLCGVCGSDLALLCGRASASLSPFASFPAVPGHEIVADVSEVGSAIRDVAVGQRVVVDPFISCQ